MMTPLERFEQKYIPEPNSGCWLWVGRSITKWQYGTVRLSHPRRWELAHRVSYKLHHGEIPPGMCVLHHCDNPCCVNPDHLFCGTRAENHKDMMSKGRFVAARGTSHGKAKLTDDIVREIRLSQESPRQCARRFGVKYTTINAIRRGTTWRHVQ